MTWLPLASSSRARLTIPSRRLASVTKFVPAIVREYLYESRLT